ncbi:cyclin A-like protein [Cryptosporidium canis]|uniref:Cyclin A-like protein n=1 Tax=Cryptosporidium canis TaxID=195482 RepID=A0A9D5HVA4_9CRYT|nr:cyclin A-like protein [Cryptosporidium canis]
MQDNKRSTKGAKAQGERGRSRPGKAKTEQGGSVSQFTCEDEQIAAYYSAMMRVEDSMWKRWGRIRADLETREIQRAMFRALASLELMYQVRFVSLYIMFLMRSSWERVVLRLARAACLLQSGPGGPGLRLRDDGRGEDCEETCACVGEARLGAHRLPSGAPVGQFLSDADCTQLHTAQD